MKLPARWTRGARILDFLYTVRPCTVEQAIAQHGMLGLTPAGMLTVYDRLVGTGCVDLRGDVYSISMSARRHFDQLTKPAEAPRAPAGPVYRPAPRPLDTTRTRMVETREGALDYRGVPSRIGDQRIFPGQGR